MNIPHCDDCKKPLGDSMKFISVAEIIFFEFPDKPRGERGLHFCDRDCLRSWVVKAENKPSIITPEIR